MSVIGTWAVGRRANGMFTVFCHIRRNDGSIGVEHLIDATTGEVMQIGNQREAVRVARAQLVRED